MPNKKWTNEEILFLKENNFTKTSKEIGEFLNKSKSSVDQRRSKLGLTRKTNPVKIGEIFGRLTIIAESTKRGKNTGQKIFVCKCECGKRTESSGSHLRYGATVSCGCFGLEQRKRASTKPSGEASWRQNYCKYRYGAKIRGLSFDLTFEEFIAISSQNCCYCGFEPYEFNHYINRKGKINLCAKAMTKESVDRAWIECNGIDRVDNKVGYIVGNCVPCCADCNFAKNDKSKEDFIKWLDRITKFRSK